MKFVFLSAFILLFSVSFAQKIDTVYLAFCNKDSLVKSSDGTYSRIAHKIENKHEGCQFSRQCKFVQNDMCDGMKIIYCQECFGIIKKENE